MKRIRWFLMLAVTTIMLLALTGCGAKTVNLNDYLTVSEEGYDTVGSADVTFDFEKYKADYTGKIKIKSKNPGQYGLELGFGDDPCVILYEHCIDYDLDVDADLKNGDVVTCKWKCDDVKAEADFGVKLSYSPVEHTISGLKEITEFDPFEYITPSFEGISRWGTMNVEKQNDVPELRYFSFDADKQSKISNGDEITIFAKGNYDEKSFIREFGKTVTKTEQKYTVDSLSHYVKDVSEIPKDNYDEMDQILRGVLAKHFDKWENDTLVSMELLGNYVFNLQERYTMTMTYYNRIYYVYKVTCTNKEMDEPFTYYWYGYFMNGLIDADGKLIINTDKYREAENGWGAGAIEKACLPNRSNYYYYGYVNLEDLYKKHAIGWGDTYDVISTVPME